jgi:hypothetical protein
MAKGRKYIPVQQNNKKYKIYLDDVRVWGPVIKKSRPPIPTYNQCKIVKW